MKISGILVIIALLLSNCTSGTEKALDKDAKLTKWKGEIKATERAFSEMAQKEGIATAFLTFAAEDAVLMRDNNLIRGRAAIKERFKALQSTPGAESLSWEPSFVDVSASGDLGYTYGNFVYTTTDSLGQKTTLEGVFHTVWKRQADGQWKFVWD